MLKIDKLIYHKFSKQIVIDFRACLSSSCINNSFQDKTKTRDEKSGPGLTQKFLFILGFCTVPELSFSYLYSI